jgi:hypothetical protein
MSSHNQDSSRKFCESDRAGVEAAMRRIANVARRRAIQASGSVVIYKDGKIIHEKTGAGTSE